MAICILRLVSGAGGTRRLAIIKGLADGADAWERDIPRADLDAVRADLMSWALETDDTVDEHDEQIVKVEGDEERSEAERAESLSQLRRMSAVD